MPETIETAFREAAACHAIGCFNAAATMFRLSIDLATKTLLPPRSDEVGGLNEKTRRDLGLRLQWLFNTQRLPEALRALATCVREDANDGAHAGTLKKEDAEDLRDFTFELLERMFTEPRRLELAAERRAARRTPKA